MSTPKITEERRAKVLEKIGNGIAVIPSAPHQRRNSDVLFPYRPDSDFYFLTRFPEPEAVAVLAPGSDEGDYILFCREKDPKREVWDGRRAGVEGAVADYQADAAFPIAEMDSMLPKLMANRDRIYYTIGRYEDFDTKVISWLNKVRQRFRLGVGAPGEIIEIGQILHEMRLFKQPEEIEKIQRAADIAAEAHMHAMRLCAPDMTEYQIQAEIEYIFMSHGCVPAYPSIVASGQNACVLHYIENSDDLTDGDLLLIDAGAEYDCYASDITRTFPINGKFSDAQRAVYEVVLETQKQCIDAVKPGSLYSDVADRATESIVDGLIELNILKCGKQEALEEKKFKPYYMHRVGHWIGLDVHDVGLYRDENSWRVLKPNMYLTIEPGIYLSPSEELDEKWHGIGIRIEDDVLVTDAGNQITTARVPKEIAEIERLMAR